MASLTKLSRLSARIAAGNANNYRTARGFRTASRVLAAQNFTMPAMSPTMTEGNISSWKVKEGDSFAAGDVLLEIETDKAQMDVEAQDDGVMAKITQGDGSKGVQVGARIAVIADPGDDISSLEIPPEDSTSSKEEDSKESKESNTNKETAPPSADPAKEEPVKDDEPTSKAFKQKGPLLPSVMQLMKENKLSPEKADEIPATGPGGRLLKGDVLAYVGSIPKSTPKKLQEYLEKREKLDLSNIKIAKIDKPPAPANIPKTIEPETVNVTLNISLNEVLRAQKKLFDALGVTMPLSTFISRAIDVANDGLPRSKAYKPTQDELFDQIIGADKVFPQQSIGHFIPQIVALPTIPIAKSSPSEDIYDLLTGSKPKQKVVTASVEAAKPAENVFVVSVGKDDERTAKIFLERLKICLEVEPGRLAL